MHAAGRRRLLVSVSVTDRPQCGGGSLARWRPITCRTDKATLILSFMFIIPKDLLALRLLSHSMSKDWAIPSTNNTAVISRLKLLDGLSMLLQKMLLQHHQYLNLIVFIVPTKKGHRSEHPYLYTNFCTECSQRKFPFWYPLVNHGTHFINVASFRWIKLTNSLCP